ncbi:hypothetical protein MTO96_048787 [Rhipicephalus appendiculatus]
MKFSSVILFCALLAAFLALTTAAEERSGIPFSWGPGCPDHNACLRNCKKYGHTTGACGILFKNCMCW